MFCDDQMNIYYFFNKSSCFIDKDIQLLASDWTHKQWPLFSSSPFFQAGTISDYYTSGFSGIYSAAQMKSQPYATAVVWDPSLKQLE